MQETPNSVLKFVQNLINLLQTNIFFGNLEFVKSIDVKNLQNVDFGKLIEGFNDFFKSYNVKKKNYYYYYITFV